MAELARNVERGPTPIATVDVVLLTLAGDRLCALLAERAGEPFKDEWALPGGYVHTEEDADAEATARRVLRAKVGFEAHWLEQLATFSGADRDPRGWSLTVAYCALVPHAALAAAIPGLSGPGAVAGTPSGRLTLRAVDEAGSMPFDHADILRAAVGRVRGKSSYSSLPAFLLDEEFTFPELHSVYQSVLGATLDRAGFRRKIMEQGFIEETGAEKVSGGRPARLHRLVERNLTQFQRTI